jgi:hypothetical protein
MSTRRDVIGGVLALGTLGSAAAPTLLGANAVPADAVHRVYRRMRFGADGEPVFWWMRGRRFGLIGNRMTPLFGMEVGSVHLVRSSSDEGYEVASASSIFYSDLESGELLSAWKNPLTGRTVEFTYAAPRASVSRYRYDSGVQANEGGEGAAGTVRRVELGTPERIGPDMWLREEVYITLASAPRNVQDMYTYRASAAALDSPAGRFVPADIQFNDYNDWSPRMEMGDLAGSSVSRCAGSKVSSFGQMPERWRTFATRAHGAAWSDVRKLLGGG